LPLVGVLEAEGIAEEDTARWLLDFVTRKVLLDIPLKLAELIYVYGFGILPLRFSQETFALGAHEYGIELRVIDFDVFSLIAEKA